MKTILRSLVNRLIREAGGAEIAEAAAVLPLMFMVLLGIFWFGQAFSIYGAITRAAQEGARAGSASAYCATCGTDMLTARVTNAVNATKAALIGSKLDPTKARHPVTVPGFTTCFPAGPSSCSASAGSNFCIEAPVHMTPRAGNSGLCGISVSFQYPFQFWLPFTSVNKQQIWISSSALARLENQ